MAEKPPLVLQPPSGETAQQIANTLRFLAADQVQKANSGHPGMPMGSAEIATVLMTRHLRIDPKDDKWLNRDRFVLSAGHASALLYAMLHLQGFLTIEDLQAKSINIVEIIAVLQDALGIEISMAKLRRKKTIGEVKYLWIGKIFT